MKIAISGKGGVGKTTLAAALARLCADEGDSVVAIDADLDSNLAAALGVPDDAAPEPIAAMTELIAERTESGPEAYGKFFKLNPRVSDIPDRYSTEHRGVRLIVLGATRRGGSGCACPENVFLRALLSHVVLQRNETVIVDMEAGIEHLGRATCKAIDALLVVVEPGRRSAQTAHTVQRMAGDIGIEHVFLVANKVRSDDDLRALTKVLPERIPLLGSMRYNNELVAADLEGRAVDAATGGLLGEVAAIRQALMEHCGQGNTA